jgi:23S rRNA (guanosine2251-2'-O)-methyltransferase
VPERIEGRNAVIEALRSGRELERVFIARGVKHDASLDEIRELATTASIPVTVVERAELDRASERGHHQGVAAVAAEFVYAALADVIARAEGKERSLVLLLDHVTDPGNLGAIIRSAEVAGAAGVVVGAPPAAPVAPRGHN